jgi:hypothetical protein
MERKKINPRHKKWYILVTIVIVTYGTFIYFRLKRYYNTLTDPNEKRVTIGVYL